MSAGRKIPPPGPARQPQALRPAQAMRAGASTTRKQVAAPPVRWPSPAAGSLQAKMSSAPQPAPASKRAPTPPPPVYHPHAAPKVSQPKMPAGHQLRFPQAPPVHWPRSTAGALQPKTPAAPRQAPPHPQPRPPAHAVQCRRVNVPGRGIIETHQLTEAELNQINRETASIPGSFDSFMEIVDAMIANEVKPAEFGRLIRDIREFLQEDLFDKRTYLPLDAEAQIKLAMGKKLRTVEELDRRYDPEQRQSFLEVAKEIRKELEEYKSAYVLTAMEDEDLEEYVDKLNRAGMGSNREYRLACQQVRTAPKSEDSYTIMKKLIGEYLGRELLAEQLGPLFDRVLSGIFILEKRPMDKSFTEGIRAGRIRGTGLVYGYVIGEIDSLFVLVDPCTTQYIPVIALESKGGALSTSAVSKQTRKEHERLLLVAKHPDRYALATREGINTGSFKDITNRFDLSSFDNLEVMTSGPIRTGSQQYDLSLGMDSRGLEKLARYLVFMYGEAFR